MRIKEFLITRYGPLPNSGRILLHDFNLFSGKNEDGKTLTIDGLIKMLLGRNIRDFKQIDRVDENPDGYVVIVDDNGKDIKLPEKGDLVRVADMSPSDCRNVFIIRNSDLSIAREGEFYTDVTDRLTGLRTEDIALIKGTLREIGKITPGGLLRNIGDEKLRTRVENAGMLVGEIDDVVTEIKGEKFDELEKESAECQEEAVRIGQQIEELEEARKREIYEKGSKALEKIKEALQKIKDLDILNDDDQELWRDSEREVATFTEQKKEQGQDLRQNTTNLKKMGDELAKKERDFQILKERKEKLDDDVRPELKNYETKRKELASKKGRDTFFTKSGTISAILLGLSILGIIVQPALIFNVLAVIFALSTAILWILKFQLLREKGGLAGLLKKINLALSKFQLEADSVEGILSNVQKFDEEYRKKADEIQEMKRKTENLEGKVEELQKKIIPKIEEKIEWAKNKISEISKRSGEASLQEYGKALKSKQKLEKLVGEKSSVLDNLFESKGKNLEENVPYWTEQVEELVEYRDKAEGVRYNEKTAAKLKEKAKECQEKHEKLQERLGYFQQLLQDIERRANNTLQLERDYLHCETSVDMNAVKDKLQTFVQNNMSVRESVLEAIRIFSDIESEEKEKVSELFGENSPISKYFTQITDGIYEEVLFDQETEGIKVRRKDGVILEAEKLSGGAYDQLYLSIRLALGDKLLKGKKGFFIMDDPFVKADPIRLQRQFKMLMKICRLGWQVLYFSAKGEVIDVLQRDIKKGTVNLVEVQGIFS